jgi:CheY-like chemotaxis protein
MTPSRTNKPEVLPLRGTRILVVDDDSDTRKMLKFVLEQNGAAVSATDAVQSAIQLFEETSPDAVVADIGLPEYNGYALIAKIRECEQHKRPRTKCVAVTGYATPIDRDLALSSGFDDYIAKPFSPGELIKALGT